MKSPPTNSPYFTSWSSWGKEERADWMGCGGVFGFVELGLLAPFIAGVGAFLALLRRCRCCAGCVTGALTCVQDRTGPCTPVRARSCASVLQNTEWEPNSHRHLCKKMKPKLSVQLKTKYLIICGKPAARQAQTPRTGPLKRIRRAVQNSGLVQVVWLLFGECWSESARMSLEIHECLLPRLFA